MGEEHRPKALPVTRREVLRLAGAAAGLGALGLGPGLTLSAFAQERPARGSRWKTRHVVLVVLAGGVRSRETIHSPENIPHLMRIAKDGVILAHVATRNLGHYASALSIFTGQFEEKAVRASDRTDSPTVFEYVRKQRGLPAREVWLSTSGGDQQLDYAYGLDRGYGERWGASLVPSEGLFASDFQGLLDKLGRPKADDDKEGERLEALERALDPAPLARRTAQPAGGAADADGRRRAERLVLDELGGGAAGLTGAGAGDARAIRVARDLLATTHPVLVGIALSNADVAHGDVNAYVDVIRRNDQELGALWAAVQADPELRGTTSLVVLPELGRDHDLNQRQGLDHSDGSRDVLDVAGFAVGPDFRRGAVVTDEVRSTQVCPTICELLGVKAERSKERPIRQLFA